MIKLNLPSYEICTKIQNEKRYVWDFVRKKHVRLTNEEWVRQHFLNLLVNINSIPASLIGVEKKIIANNMDKRFDILVFNSSAKPVMIIECKAPEIKISQDTFMQASNYNTVLKAPILIVTNGLEHYCAHINFEQEKIDFLDFIPDYQYIKKLNI
ncbi:MAG: type I restriction enzyme HsdR N-terminal domain-containing protein [Bacteroidales bacterium]|nr:type I restriction enzyme HsdR N-terminal domain-containing protein [Bacteroidales bacterium]